MTDARRETAEDVGTPVGTPELVIGDDRVLPETDGQQAAPPKEPEDAP